MCAKDLNTTIDLVTRDQNQTRHCAKHVMVGAISREGGMKACKTRRGPKRDNPRIGAGCYSRSLPAQPRPVSRKKHGRLALGPWRSRVPRDLRRGQYPMHLTYVGRDLEGGRRPTVPDTCQTQACVVRNEGLDVYKRPCPLCEGESRSDHRISRQYNFNQEHQHQTSTWPPSRLSNPGRGFGQLPPAPPTRPRPSPRTSAARR